MYVRWKVQRHTHKAPARRRKDDFAFDEVTERLKRVWVSYPTGEAAAPDTICRAAYLVKSERVNGKPRQRIIAYLGVIGEGEVSLRDRLYFWREARKRILKLGVAGVLDAEGCARAELALSQVVPAPSAAQQEEADKEDAALRAWLFRPRGRPPIVVPT